MISDKSRYKCCSEHIINPGCDLHWGDDSEVDNFSEVGHPNTSAAFEDKPDMKLFIDIEGVSYSVDDSVKKEIDTEDDTIESLLPEDLKDIGKEPRNILTVLLCKRQPCSTYHGMYFRNRARKK